MYIRWLLDSAQCDCIACGATTHSFNTGSCGAASGACSATQSGSGCYTTDPFTGCDCTTRVGSPAGQWMFDKDLDDATSVATALGEYCPNGDDITTEAECAAAAAALGLTFVAAFDGPGDHQNCLNAPQHAAPGVYFNTAAVPGDPIPTYSSLCSAVACVAYRPASASSTEPLATSYHSTEPLYWTYGTDVGKAECNCIVCGATTHSLNTGFCSAAVPSSCSATQSGSGCYTDEGFSGCQCHTVPRTVSITSMVIARSWKRATDVVGSVVVEAGVVKHWSATGLALGASRTFYAVPMDDAENLGTVKSLPFITGERERERERPRETEIETKTETERVGIYLTGVYLYCSIVPFATRSPACR